MSILKLLLTILLLLIYFGIILFILLKYNFKFKKLVGILLFTIPIFFILGSINLGDGSSKFSAEDEPLKEYKSIEMKITKNNLDKRDLCVLSFGNEESDEGLGFSAQAGNLYKIKENESNEYLEDLEDMYELSPYKDYGIIYCDNELQVLSSYDKGTKELYIFDNFDVFNEGNSEKAKGDLVVPLPKGFGGEAVTSGKKSKFKVTYGDEEGVIVTFLEDNLGIILEEGIDIPYEMTYYNGDTKKDEVFKGIIKYEAEKIVFSKSK